MQDPLTVAFTIPRPWPEAVQGPRGRWWMWPPIITVWHHDPSGIDDIVCPTHPGNRWRFHIHHWRVQVHPLQQLRRRLLTRCEVCGGRSAKNAPVNFSSQWYREKTPWWRGETGLAHMACKGVALADTAETAAETVEACDVCGLPDPYGGDGDGIGSCTCPRSACGAAVDSWLCTCPPDDYEETDPR